MRWAAAARYSAGAVLIGTWGYFVLHFTGFFTSELDTAMSRHRVSIAWLPGESVLAAAASGTMAEVLLNLAMFAPFGVASASLLRANLWQVSLAAFLLALLIECAQYLILVNRVAAFDDVILNVLGAGLGWGAVLLVTRLRRRISQPERDLWKTAEPAQGDP